MSSTKSPTKSKNSENFDSRRDTRRGEEKSNHKMYGGFQARTIRSFWEQHNQQEIEIQPEVLSKLAEDTTYRVWEIINSVKTYTKHSGGTVTYEITNDVLKDVNCEPIVGANCAPWEKIENDGFFFFNEDETVSTRDEYMNEVTLAENGPLALNVSWLLDDKIGEDYISFYNQIIEAIFVGDPDCFKFALQIISNSPHITGLLKHFLKKWIDMIAFDYTEMILNRSIKFLEALIRNPCTNNNEMNTELKYLCQLLVNLLVGPDKEENLDFADNFNDQPMMLMGNDLNIKKEEDFDHHLNSFGDISVKMENLDEFNNFDLNDNFPAPVEEEEALELSDASTEDSNERAEDDFNYDLISFKLSTNICSDKYVDQICNILGLCSSKWAGVESLCTYLLINRVENYFATNKRVAMEKDYDWLQRIIRGLWCLGEFAFREFLIYFEKIDTEASVCPQSFFNYLNFSGIFIRGKHDIFFYEYIHDAVGDKILPFSLYYADFLLRLDKKNYKIHKKSLDCELFYNYPQKIKLLASIKPIRHSLVPYYNEMFPDHQRFIDKNATYIYFRFSGCRQIFTKKTLAKKFSGKKIGNNEVLDEFSSAQEQQKKAAVVQNQELLRRFNQRIVIAKKKFCKSATNKIPYRRMDNFHYLNL